MQTFGFRSTLFDDINKLSYEWKQLENVFYSNTVLSKYSYQGATDSSILKININAFFIATAKNGGPFALLLNNKIVPSGSGMFKDKIFVMSAYGDKISTIEIKKVFKNDEDLSIRHWAMFEFTKEEDILLISQTGVILILDPMSGETLHRHDFKEQFMNRNMIENWKYRDNSIIIKTGQHWFYYIHDVYHPEIVEFGQPNFEMYDDIDEERKGPVRTTNLPKRTGVDDYIMIPKAKSWSKKMEILITHPSEGIMLLDDQKNTIYSTDMSQFCSDDVGRLGKITNFALSANDKLLTFYSSKDSTLYVFKSDLLKLLSKVQTDNPRPHQLAWWANDIPILIYDTHITMVGPHEKLKIDLKEQDDDKNKGIHYCWEIDGIRFITSNQIYFIERVQQSSMKALTFISADPSNKLIDAFREYELKSENTERIFREIGENLIDAIKTVIDAATFQWNIPIQKLLCEVASFGKKKIDADNSFSDMYVQYIKYLSSVNKLRYSTKCRRAITYKQLKAVDPKVLLPIQLKYRDYFLVLREVKNLRINKQKFINMCYEEWACTLLKNSKRSSNDLQNDILEKLSLLEAEIRSKGGNEKLNAITGSASTIDYTKIAKVAKEVGKNDIAIQLVNYEQSVIKKIPYLLSLDQFDAALEISVINGDMNIVHKVISKILEKHGQNEEWLKAFLDRMRFAHRKFITYAKREENLDLVKKLRDLMGEIYNFSEVKMMLRRENEISRQKPEEREVEMKSIEDTFKKIYNDSFKVSIIKCQKKLLLKQIDLNKTFKTKKYNGQTARQSIEALLKSAKQNEAKSLAKSIKMNETCYLGLEAKVFANMGKFDQIEKYLEVKKPKIPYSYLAELCIEKHKMKLAREFVDKIQDEDLRESLEMKLR